MIYLVSAQISVYDDDIHPLAIKEAIDILESFDELGLDTETEGLDCYSKKLLLLQLGTFEIQVLFDIKSFGGKIPPELFTFLSKNHKLYILQNAKFDLKFMYHQGIVLTNVYDTMLAEIILTNGMQYSGRDLATIADKYCNVTLDKSVRGEIIKAKSLTSRILKYGAKDIAYLPEIKRKQLALVESLNLTRALALDNSFVIVLAYVEYCGIKLDVDKWRSRTTINIAKSLEFKNQLNSILWEDKKYSYFSGMSDMFTGAQDCILNWDSPKQVIALFKSYGINVQVRIKGELKETVDAKVLKPQKDMFPILVVYLKYKKVQQEVSTFGLNWFRYISSKTGRVHTTFQQLMDTGRLSCGNKNDGTPNLQNIPNNPEARQCFIVEDGNMLIGADYKGQETIVLANASKEENLIQFYAKGLDDMHSYVAFLMYNEVRSCKLEDITPADLKYVADNYAPKRQIAKAAGFAIAYGGNGATIAKNCNIPKKDGEFVYDSYFAAFPQMKAYFDLGFQKACYYRYIEFNPITKRKYFYRKDNDFFALKDEVNDPYFYRDNANAKDIFKKYSFAKSSMQNVSQNYPIQGSAADITKYACILFFKEILRRKLWGIVKIINLIHDEILVECPINMVEEIEPLLISCMEEAGKPFCKTVPLYASAKHGKYWVH